MTTLQRQLRAACPYVKHNGPEGYICLHRPAYNDSNITPPSRHCYSNKKCNGCFLMYPKPTTL